VASRKLTIDAAIRVHQKKGQKREAGSGYSPRLVWTIGLALLLAVIAAVLVPALIG
jgi:hypothetical protein